MSDNLEKDPVIEEEYEEEPYAEEPYEEEPYVEQPYTEGQGNNPGKTVGKDSSELNKNRFAW